MSVTELVLNRFGTRPADLPHWRELFPSLGTASGEQVSPRIALGLSAYFACIRNISEDIAKLPLHVFRKQGSDRFEQPEHAVDYLVSVAPNDDMTAMSFRETLTAHACGFGGGYAEIVHDGRGQVSALWPLDPTTVKMERQEGQLIYVVTVQGKKTILPAHRVLHIHGLSYDGITGYNIPSLAREVLGTILAAQKFAGAFFGNGTWLGGVLQHPAALSDQALKHLRDTWVERHGGAGKAHKPAILEEGMTYNQLGVKPIDAQMTEILYFGVEEVCRYFRMQPHKVQHLLRATFSNIEHQGLEYVGDTMMPWGVRWEQEIKRKLFLSTERALFVKHNFASLLRADAPARAGYYSTMLQNGVYSINEIRALEELNRIEHGDKHHIQAQMQELGAPPPEPTPPPVPDAPNDEDDTDEDDADRARAIQVVEAHAPILAEAYRRLLRVEADKVTRARKRGDLDEWAPHFYAEHRCYVRTALKSAVDTILATARLCGCAEPNPMLVGAQVDAMTARHVETSRDDLGGEIIFKWLDDRPEAAARGEIRPLVDLLTAQGAPNA